jgi:hypothetical protein
MGNYSLIRNALNAGWERQKAQAERVTVQHGWAIPGLTEEGQGAWAIDYTRLQQELIKLDAAFSGLTPLICLIGDAPPPALTEIQSLEDEIEQWLARVAAFEADLLDWHEKNTLCAPTSTLSNPAN